MHYKQATINEFIILNLADIQSLKKKSIANSWIYETFDLPNFTNNMTQGQVQFSMYSVFSRKFAYLLTLTWYLNQAVRVIFYEIEKIPEKCEIIKVVSIWHWDSNNFRLQDKKQHTKTRLGDSTQKGFKDFEINVSCDYLFFVILGKNWIIDLIYYYVVDLMFFDTFFPSRVLAICSICHPY